MDSHSIEVATLFLGLLGVLWAYEQYNQKRFDTIWKRIDDKQKSYFNTFVEQKIYNNDQMHNKERTDEKFSNILTSINEKFAILSEKIDDLKSDRSKNQ